LASAEHGGASVHRRTELAINRYAITLARRPVISHAERLQGCSVDRESGERPSTTGHRESAVRGGKLGAAERMTRAAASRVASAM
jgi:hypothetical protein